MIKHDVVKYKKELLQSGEVDPICKLWILTTRIGDIRWEEMPTRAGLCVEE